MSAWSIYADNHQRRQEGDMTLSVKPDRGGYKWIIARGGAVVAGGWASRSFRALEDADTAAAKELREAPAQGRMLALENALYEGTQLQWPGGDERSRRRDAHTLAVECVTQPPRIYKGVAVAHACKRLGIKNTFKAIRAYVAAEDATNKEVCNADK